MADAAAAPALGAVGVDCVKNDSILAAVSFRFRSLTRVAVHSTWLVNCGICRWSVQEIARPSWRGHEVSTRASSTGALPAFQRCTTVSVV